MNAQQQQDTANGLVMHAVGPIVGEIIDDLIAFAVAHAAGKRSARGSLDAARMRLDELHARVHNVKRAAPFASDIRQGEKS